MSDRGSEYSVISAEWSEAGVRKQYVAELGTSFNDKTFFDRFGSDQVVFGQYASVHRIEDGTYEAVRDPLGIGKLFYTETNDGELHFSNRFVDLFQHGSQIFSLPAGMHVRLGSKGLRKKIRSLGPEECVDGDFTPQSFNKEYADGKVRSFKKKFDLRLEQAFLPLKKLEDEGWTVFVALSGGLDSSIIAGKAVHCLANPVACTLDLGKSEDSEKSIKIADHLGIKHLTFGTSREEILEMLGDAPLGCQDFRDFNVHCAVLNLLLARNIRQRVDSDPAMDKDKVIVLTGDLMNEFTCDYTAEIVDDVEYYKLPGVGKKELQRYLINGLDTSDRELSPFGSYGIKCIQPYAVLFDLYANLDESILLHEDPKKLLNSVLVDLDILELIPKVKLRAQVGSRENMGILGLCHSLGLNNRCFRKSLLERSGYPKGKIPIFVGKYDVEKFM